MALLWDSFFRFNICIMQRTFIHWKITVDLVETGCATWKVEVNTDEPKPLVQGLSSEQLLLGGGLPSSPTSDILQERSSSKCYKVVT